MARSEPMLTASECAAYGAPFPDRDHRAGVRRFPELVPITPEMEGADLGRRAAQWWRQDWTGESFMAIGMKDPVLGPDVMHRLRAVIKGCPAPLEIEDGGHFVQEHGDIIARAALDRWTNRS